jgi:hypothetical protein
MALNNISLKKNNRKQIMTFIDYNQHVPFFSQAYPNHLCVFIFGAYVLGKAYLTL